jgi:hypothetical protein
MCKNYGGLGIPNLRDLNISLLASWLKRYQADEGKLWKQVIDDKHATDRPNIFYCNTTSSSQFFRGVMWAAKAAHMGYRWEIGNGRKVKFWEDNWLGPSSLAIQYWDIYVILNEKNKTVQELCDGRNLKCTFRRSVDENMYRTWEEIVQLASTITFSGDQDEMVWTLNSNGIYSSQSLYKVINFRGVQPVHTPAIWCLKIPPRVHFFLWLLTQNKVLTRDNVKKRKHIEDDRCLFCSEVESVHHLFFDCVVAKQMWEHISDCTETLCGSCFENIGTLWISNKKNVVTNIFTSAALWGLWKLRNSLAFREGRWKDVNSLLQKIATLVHNWKILCPVQQTSELEQKLSSLKLSASQPARLACCSHP